MGSGDLTIKVGGTGGSQYELRVTQTLNGDIESVRLRLSAALNRLGYDVLSEAPQASVTEGTTEIFLPDEEERVTAPRRIEGREID